MGRNPQGRGSTPDSQVGRGPEQDQQLECTPEASCTLHLLPLKGDLSQAQSSHVNQLLTCQGKASRLLPPQTQGRPEGPLHPAVP